MHAFACLPNFFTPLSLSLFLTPSPSFTKVEDDGLKREDDTDMRSLSGDKRRVLKTVM